MITDVRLLKKSSQSDSALDVVFQQSTADESEEKQQQQMVEAEETMSTDSSIPGVDEEGRKIKKKPRFQFSSLIKRNRNKTWLYSIFHIFKIIIM